jgi:hypothetical protein
MAITINGGGSITGISAGGLPDDSVTTDDIADDAVTAAKLADTYLTPTGDGSQLTGISGSQWELIEEYTADNTANTKIFSWTAGDYYQVKIVIDNIVPATDNASLYARFGTDSGTTILTSAGYDYSYYISGGTTYSNLTGISTFVLTPLAGVGSDVGEAVSGSCTFYISNTADGKINGMFGQLIHSRSTGANEVQTIQGHYDLATSSVIDSIAILLSTGNFESGTIRAYGFTG